MIFQTSSIYPSFCGRTTNSITNQSNRNFQTVFLTSYQNSMQLPKNQKRFPERILSTLYPYNIGDDSMNPSTVVSHSTAFVRQRAFISYRRSS